MAKQEYACFTCGKPVFRWPSQAIRGRVHCSVACKSASMKIHLKGSDNPNYRHGLHVTDSICACGEVKDYRAKTCGTCAAKVLDFFKPDTKVRNATLWRYIKTFDLLPWSACSWCGQGWHWNGRPLSLHLDHIDGVNSNNSLDNLRVLCPNCHTQTPTYAAKNRRKVSDQSLREF